MKNYLKKHIFLLGEICLLLIVLIIVGVNHIQNSPLKSQKENQNHTILQSNNSQQQNLDSSTRIFGANIIGPSINTTQIADSGISITTYWLYIPEFLDSAGNIDQEKLKQTIEFFSSKRGRLEVMVHLMPQTRKEAKAKGGFSAPPNMSIYSKQVIQIAQALKGKVKFYSIGNEVPSTWNDTIEHYGEMLKTAYHSIKTVDRDAIVTDSGMSILSYLGLVAKKIQSEKGDLAAIEFVNGYTRLHTASALKPFFPVQNSTELQRLLNIPIFEQAEKYVNLVLTNYCDTIDAYQLHFYQEWQFLTDVLDFIDDRMTKNNCVKPIQIWELGYGVDNLKNYREEEHAENIWQESRIINQRGIKLINYVTFYDKPGFARGLYDSNGRERPAAKVFKDWVFSSK